MRIKLHEQIMLLLPATSSDLSLKLQITWEALDELICTLRKRGLIVKSTGEIWRAPVSDQSNRSLTFFSEESAQVKTGPAEQLGMKRDRLVAALFGESGATIR